MRVTAKPKGVLPGFKFANSLLAHLAVAHYLDNLTFGFLERHLGAAKGAVIQALQRMTELLGPLHPLIIEEIREAAVLFADETGHRSDGANGYVWAAFTDFGEAFLVRKSRAGAVALEMFGDERLFGVMLTDRYGGYNKRARDLRDENMEICHRNARNRGIQKMQNLFREKSANLFNWVENRAVPADNNRAERGLRPIVIARKISFGTQSDLGMKTMEVLLTVLRTLQLRTGNAEAALKRILDELARNPQADVRALLPPAKSASAEAQAAA